jgi:hypothetical protein
MRHAHVIAAKVVNIIEADAGFVPDIGDAVLSDAANIGDTYTGGVFTSPVVVVDRKRQILIRLDVIDTKSVNVLRDAVIKLAKGAAVPAAMLAKIVAFDDEVTALRAELALLP